MGWAWLIMLLATYPWLLGADLASDVLARGGFVVFISGVCIVAPLPTPAAHSSHPLCRLRWLPV